MSNRITKDENSTSAPLLPNGLLPAALSVEKGNCLIAKFMGYKELSEQESWAMQKPYLLLKDTNGVYVSHTQLKYHTAWDWLMPVVEKIHIDRKVKEVSIRPGKTRIWLKEHSYIESPCLPENNSITECWLAVIKFIIWHNQQSVSEGSR